MSMHKKVKSEMELAGLESAGLSANIPSQLSDSFILGVKYAVSQYDELVRENEELKLALGIASAFPVKVSMQCRKMIDSKLSSLEFLSMLCDSANRAISESSCDQLAGIKADAVLELTKTDLGYSVETSDFSSEWVYSKDDVMDYAENLRKDKQ